MRDVSRTELENVIDEWIVGRNAERNREILKRRMIDGIMLRAACGRMGFICSSSKIHCLPWTGEGFSSFIVNPPVESKALTIRAARNGGLLVYEKCTENAL